MQELILELLTEHLLEFILSILSLVVSYYVVPAIKNDLVPFLKDKRIYNLLSKFVNAVEKLADAGVIEKVDKKNEVIKLLNSQGIVVDEKLDAFIESAVKELDVILDTTKTEIKENM